MSMAAAANLEMHCVDLSQAFIQASWADLGCYVVRDRVAKTLTLRQTSYIRRVLAAHGMSDANPVKTPLEPGVRLSKRDSPGGNAGGRLDVERALEPG
mmetsp:Transcript_29955/g.61617  ORF Transcript_29955/g.61617 Transcript_29955/m.61617 type:complete len:98 (+) Transcript_29955:932-1225(+)